MAVKKYKPVTPGMRDMTGYTFEEITKSTPERSLLVTKQNYGGRNAQGRVTVRHRGGGARRFILQKLQRSSTIRIAQPVSPFFSMWMVRSDILLRPWT